MRKVRFWPGCMAGLPSWGESMPMFAVHAIGPPESPQRGDLRCRSCTWRKFSRAPTPLGSQRELATIRTRNIIVTAGAGGTVNSGKPRSARPPEFKPLWVLFQGGSRRGAAGAPMAKITKRIHSGGSFPSPRGCPEAPSGGQPRRGSGAGASAASPQRTEPRDLSIGARPFFVARCEGCSRSRRSDAYAVRTPQDGHAPYVERAGRGAKRQADPFTDPKADGSPAPTFLL